MAGGDGFTSAQRQQVDKAIRDAETTCRYEFSVYVGPTDGEPRAFAERLHGALVAPDRSILVLVDPAGHAIEVVTGATVRGHLDDGQVGLAVIEMQTQFQHDDLVGGIVRGINRLASAAHKPPTLHADRA